MRHLRFLPAAIVAALVLAISRPAGTGSEHAGTARTNPPERPAASARAADRDASAETPDPMADSGQLPHCGREILAGVAKRMPPVESLAEALAATHDAEHMLTAAMLTLHVDARRGVDLLTRAWEINPAHPLIAMTRLDACMAHPDLQGCATREVVADALRIEGTNGALWSRIAVNRLEHGDEAGALEALQRAATAPRYDVYWIDRVGLFQRALAASTSLSYSERTIVAVGITAATWRPDIELVSICPRESGASLEWLPVCGDFGRRLEADGDLLQDTFLGLTIQAGVYEALGDEQNAAIASRKREELSTMTTLRDLEDAQLLLMRDERLLSDYLGEFGTYGELAATQFLKNEVARRQALPGYDPCG